MQIFTQTIKQLIDIKEPQTYADALDWAGELTKITEDMSRCMAFLADIQDPIVRGRHAKDFRNECRDLVDALIKQASGLEDEDRETVTASMFRKGE